MKNVSLQIVTLIGTLCVITRTTENSSEGVKLHMTECLVQNLSFLSLFNAVIPIYSLTFLFLIKEETFSKTSAYNCHLCWGWEIWNKVQR